MYMRSAFALSVGEQCPIILGHLPFVVLHAGWQASPRQHVHGISGGCPFKLEQATRKRRVRGHQKMPVRSEGDRRA